MGKLSERIKVVDFGYDARGLLRKFVDFPWKLYKNNPYYVPQLDTYFLGNRLLGAVGLFEKEHPFAKISKVRFFLALDGDEVVGRIAANICYHYNEYQKEDAGFWGFFEVIDNQEIANLLFDRALQFLKENEAKIIYGPANFTSNYTWGLLINDFENISYLETPYNMPYYQKLVENYGFQKAMDLYAYKIKVHVEDEETAKRQKYFEKLHKFALKHANIEIRDIDVKNLDRDAHIILDIHTEAWSKNWGHLPITEGELQDIEETMKLFLDRKLIKIAYVDGKPAAFLWAMPDMNYLLRRRGSSKFWNNDYFRIIRALIGLKKVPRIRLIGFGIKEEYRKLGLDALLYYSAMIDAQKNKYYKESELSWILENNELIKAACIKFGGVHYRTWRIYSLNL